MILFNQETNSIGKVQLLNRMSGAAFDRGGEPGGGPRREEGVESAVFRSQIGAGNTLEIGARDSFYGGEVAFRKIKIAGGQPIRAEILRLSLHRFAGA